MPLGQIAGHRHISSLLSRAILRDSLPPSLLFSGPAGVGKYTTGVALAQALNCLEAPVSQSPTTPGAAESARDAGDACGQCAACTRIARGVHPDVMTLSPGDTGAIKIDAVREAVDRVAYRPFEGRKRVVLIDEADALGADAQSAFLKTLEEPPDTSLFVLVTSRPDALLPTVRSRCPQLRFGRLTAEEICAVLTSAHGYSEADARAVAAASAGSLGKALQEASEPYRVARDAAQRLLGVAATNAGPRPMLTGAAEFVKGPKASGGAARDALTLRLKVMASLLRDLQVYSSGASDGLVVNQDIAGALRGLTDAFDHRRLAGAFAAVTRAIGAVDRNASPKVVADWLVFQL